MKVTQTSRQSFASCSDALGSSPHDEYPKETEIGEDKTLGLNTVRELWLPSMSLRWSNSPRVHSSQISWRKITGETLPTWIGIKVAVSLYHQCCTRILPCQVVEESRILPHNAGWGQRHSQLRSGCNIALTGTPIHRHPSINRVGVHGLDVLWFLIRQLYDFLFTLSSNL